jgi:hypothetical protein
MAHLDGIESLHTIPVPRGYFLLLSMNVPLETVEALVTHSSILPQYQ